MYRNKHTAPTPFSVKLSLRTEASADPRNRMNPMRTPTLTQPNDTARGCWEREIIIIRIRSSGRKKQLENGGAQFRAVDVRRMFNELLDLVLVLVD